MAFTKQEQREWLNSQPRKPMSAAVLFVDVQGKILLVKPCYRETWNLPGGIVNEHESPLAAAAREVEEELGLVIDPSRLEFRIVDYRPAKDGFTDKLYFYFSGGILDAPSILKISLQTSELDEMRFVSLDEVEQLTSTWTHRQIALSLFRQPANFYTEGGARINGKDSR